MLLYHGSNINIKEINLAMCRPYKDFGKGFYLTEIREQAEKMARRVARSYGGNAVLNQYEFDKETVMKSTLRIKDFETLLKGLEYRETTNQYSFHTERAIRFLKKVGSQNV